MRLYFIDKKFGFSKYILKAVNTKNKQIMFWIFGIIILSIINSLLGYDFRINNIFSTIFVVFQISLLNYIIFSIKFK